MSNFKNWSTLVEVMGTNSVLYFLTHSSSSSSSVLTES